MTTDPRGPFRTVKAVEQTPSANLTTFLECDHVAHLNPTMRASRPGDRVRCFSCVGAPETITDLIRSGKVCPTCADEGLRSCSCWGEVETIPCGELPRLDENHWSEGAS